MGALIVAKAPDLRITLPFFVAFGVTYCGYYKLLFQPASLADFGVEQFAAKADMPIQGRRFALKSLHHFPSGVRFFWFIQLMEDHRQKRMTILGTIFGDD